MARNMEETRTDIYRTVVKTTYLEDVPSKTERGQTDPGGKAGRTYVQIYGPHAESWFSRDYSGRRTYKWVDDGVYPDKDQYGRPHWRAGQVKQKTVDTATKVVQHQKLTSVLSINPNGSLTLGLDWITQ